MTAMFFGVYVLIVWFGVIAIAARNLDCKAALTIVIGSIVWMTYVGLMSYFGAVSNTSLRPPGAAYVLLPVFVLVALLVRSKVGLRTALALPVALVIGFQVFRVGVELLIHRLYADGMVPQLMTYEGGNVDVTIGLTAPLAAWLVTRGRGGQRLALAWNVIGLFALANVAVRAVGTSPGALNFIHSSVPNIAVGRFPFTYLAGFFAPLAVVAHVLAIRHLRSLMRPEATTPTVAGWGQFAEGVRP